MVDFPTPRSPIMAPMRLQMHDRNGVHVNWSDEDGDDEDEAMATGTDVEEILTSEGETYATPESGGSTDGGLPQAMAGKWVAVNGGLETVHPPPLPSPPRVMTLEASPAVRMADARWRSGERASARTHTYMGVPGSSVNANSSAQGSDQVQ